MVLIGNTVSDKVVLLDLKQKNQNQNQILEKPHEISITYIIIETKKLPTGRHGRDLKGKYLFNKDIDFDSTGIVMKLNHSL